MKNLKLYEEFLKEQDMNEAESPRYEYKWGTWKASIYKGFRSWNWSVESTGGEGDMYNFRSDIDDDFKNPKEAEKDMLAKIEDKVGHGPKSQADKMK